MKAQTLLALSGQSPSPAKLTGGTLILIDYQNEYLDGPIALPDGKEAIERAAQLLKAARTAGTRIVHIAHKGPVGGLFDRTAVRGAIVEELKPADGELVIEKPRPNAFSGTDLAERVGPAGTEIMIAGFMTHMCVSSTTRAALDLGYRSTVVGDACATRDLPSGNSVISAGDLHAAELAALGDRFAWIVNVTDVIG